MRYNIQDQVLQKFIESPKQSNKPNSNFPEASDEKAAHHADLAQGYELPSNEELNTGFDIYERYNENERYD